MSGGGIAETSPSTAGSVLTQQEVADLLVDRRQSPADGIKGYLQKLSQQNSISGRLPVLDIIVDRFVRSLNTTMRNFTGENVDISLDNMYDARFSDVIGSLQPPVMIGLVRSSSWRGMALFCVDSQLIYAVVDVLLGGRRGGDRDSLEGRTFTTIERRLVKRMLGTMLADLEAAVLPVGTPGFSLEGIETNPRFARAARPDTPTIVSVIRFYMEDRGGKILIVFPAPLFHDVREVLGQPFYGDSTDGDIGWTNQVNSQAMITQVRVEVVLDTVSVPLAEVMGWAPGSQLHLNATRSTPVDLKIGTKIVAKGELGRNGAQLVVRLL